MFEFLMLIGFFCAGLCQLLPQENKAAKKSQRYRIVQKEKRTKKSEPDFVRFAKNQLTFGQYSLYKKVN